MNEKSRNSDLVEAGVDEYAEVAKAPKPNAKPKKAECEKKEEVVKEVVEVAVEVEEDACEGCEESK